MVDKKHENLVHVFLIRYDQIDLFSSYDVESEAFPAFERCVAGRIYMLPKNPESGRYGPEGEALYLIDAAAGATKLFMILISVKVVKDALSCLRRQK